MPQVDPEIEGNGRSLPLVLLPGTLCDARLFEPLRIRLAGLLTQTVPIPRRESMREAAEAVLAKVPEHFALLGFSLGGMVAMEMALCAPERVRGLALISTSPLPVPAELHAARRAAVVQAQRLGLRSFVREVLWPGYGSRSITGELSTLLEEMAEAVGHAAYAQQTELALSRGDYRPRLGNVRCPALILAGLKDQVCPPAVQGMLAMALAGSRLVMLPGAGHLTVMENSDDVAAAVAAWFHTVVEAGFDRTSRPATAQQRPEGIE